VVAYSNLIKSTNEIREKVDEKDMKKKKIESSNEIIPERTVTNYYD
jgi:hypothetical protein